MSQIYQQMKAAGVKIDNHESDLYVPVNADTQKLITKYRFRSNVTTFVNQIDGNFGLIFPLHIRRFGRRKPLAKGLDRWPGRKSKKPLTPFACPSPSWGAGFFFPCYHLRILQPISTAH